MRVSPVRTLTVAVLLEAYVLDVSEEFGIYLNYVRKLGFEETPDYEFLRELFAKVMKNNGDLDDGVYDWNLINGNSLNLSAPVCARAYRGSGGKGWEASLGQNQILAQIQNTGNPASPQPGRRESERQARDERRRASQVVGPNGAVVPPSPAMIRNSSKPQGRNIPAALTPGGGNTPGQVTPLSAAAEVNVPIGTPNRRMSQQPSASHPYAHAAGGYDSYGRPERAVTDDYSATNHAQYGRSSPMVSSVGAAPPAVSHVRAVGGEVGVANGGDYHGQQEEPRPKNTFWQILTCRCG